MHDIALGKALIAEVESVVEEMGFSIVELRVGRSHKLSQVTLVLYRSDGMGVNELSNLHRLVRPLLEGFEELEDLNLVVSSPGVDRKIKSREEYPIFKGRGLKVMLRDSSVWRGGIIQDADERLIHLLTPEGLEKIEMNAIKSAKLDYSQEVVKTIGFISL